MIAVLDPFFSESKFFLNNVFIICNLRELLLILHQIHKLSFKIFLPEYHMDQMHFGKYFFKRISALASVTQIVGVSSYALEVCRLILGQTQT